MNVIAPIFANDEGLYLDSKTITFQASWWLFTSFSELLFASGLWQLPIGFHGETGKNLWAITLRQISGWKGTLAARQSNLQDVIVDMGGP